MRRWRQSSSELGKQGYRTGRGGAGSGRGMVPAVACARGSAGWACPSVFTRLACAGCCGHATQWERQKGPGRSCWRSHCLVCAAVQQMWHRSCAYNVCPGSQTPGSQCLCPPPLFPFHARSYCQDVNMPMDKSAQVLAHYARHRASDPKFASPFAYSAFQVGGRSKPVFWILKLLIGHCFMVVLEVLVCACVPRPAVGWMTACIQYVCMPAVGVGLCRRACSWGTQLDCACPLFLARSSFHSTVHA